ncbi:Polycomb protein suz12 [Sarcoptes scabiei]|uniref:Polycomb protein suz12 n=1 Tax=Sarcoptes scabiei TaxID=52283 RepID=A0A834REM8_SARSC|nr:Polycomb protein suz12 [Sarcoptes scabiei]
MKIKHSEKLWRNIFQSYGKVSFDKQSELERKIDNTRIRVRTLRNLRHHQRRQRKKFCDLLRRFLREKWHHDAQNFLIFAELFSDAFVSPKHPNESNRKLPLHSEEQHRHEELKLSSELTMSKKNNREDLSSLPSNLSLPWVEEKTKNFDTKLSDSSSSLRIKKIVDFEGTKDSSSFVDSVPKSFIVSENTDETILIKPCCSKNLPGQDKNEIVKSHSIESSTIPTRTLSASDEMIIIKPCCSKNIPGEKKNKIIKSHKLSAIITETPQISHKILGQESITESPMVDKIYLIQNEKSAKAKEHVTINDVLAKAKKLSKTNKAVLAKYNKQLLDVVKRNQSAERSKLLKKPLEVIPAKTISIKKHDPSEGNPSEDGEIRTRVIDEKTNAVICLIKKTGAGDHNDKNRSELIIKFTSGVTSKSPIVKNKSIGIQSKDNKTHRFAEGESVDDQNVNLINFNSKNIDDRTIVTSLSALTPVAGTDVNLGSDISTLYDFDQKNYRVIPTINLDDDDDDNCEEIQIKPVLLNNPSTSIKSSTLKVLQNLIKWLHFYWQIGSLFEPKQHQESLSKRVKNSASKPTNIVEIHDDEKCVRKTKEFGPKKDQTKIEDKKIVEPQRCSARLMSSTSKYSSHMLEEARKNVVRKSRQHIDPERIINLDSDSENKSCSGSTKKSLLPAEIKDSRLKIDTINKSKSVTSENETDAVEEKKEPAKKYNYKCFRRDLPCQHHKSGEEEEEDDDDDDDDTSDQDDSDVPNEYVMTLEENLHSIDPKFWDLIFSIKARTLSREKIEQLLESYDYKALSVVPVAEKVSEINSNNNGQDSKRKIRSDNYITCTMKVQYDRKIDPKHSIEAKLPSRSRFRSADSAFRFTEELIESTNAAVPKRAEHQICTENQHEIITASSSSLVNDSSESQDHRESDSKSDSQNNQLRKSVRLQAKNHGKLYIFDKNFGIIRFPNPECENPKTENTTDLFDVQKQAKLEKKNLVTKTEKIVQINSLRKSKRLSLKKNPLKTSIVPRADDDDGQRDSHSVDDDQTDEEDDDYTPMNSNKSSRKSNPKFFTITELDDRLPTNNGDGDDPVMIDFLAKEKIYTLLDSVSIDARRVVNKSEIKRIKRLKNTIMPRRWHLKTLKSKIPKTVKVLRFQNLVKCSDRIASKRLQQFNIDEHFYITEKRFVESFRRKLRLSKSKPFRSVNKFLENAGYFYDESESYRKQSEPRERKIYKIGSFCKEIAYGTQLSGEEFIKTAQDFNHARYFGKIQKLFSIYRMAAYNHSDRPLYLSSSLSYLKHYQKEYDHFEGRIQRNDENDNDSSDSATDTEQADKVESSALVLDPLMLDKIDEFRFAKINYFVVKRQETVSGFHRGSIKDFKLYVGHSFIDFHDNEASIIYDRIIIPIKLLFDSELENKQTPSSNDDHKYYINAVVTYYRENKNLAKLFSKNRAKHKLRSNFLLPDRNEKTNELQFYLNFELRNIEDIHFVEKLPKMTGCRLNQRESKYGQLSYINGEETHLLSEIYYNVTRNGDQEPRKNVITKLYRWRRIFRHDILYRENRNSHKSLFHVLNDLRAFKKEHSKYTTYFTLRLIRSPIDQKIQSRMIKKKFGCKIVVRKFNVGEFMTKIKLIAAREKVSLTKSNNSIKNNRTKINRRIILPRLIDKNICDKIIYNIEGLQNNLIMNELYCPFCASSFTVIAQLSIHFHLNHERFNFKITIDLKWKTINIRVSINHQFVSMFDNEPLMVALRDGRYRNFGFTHGSRKSNQTFKRCNAMMMFVRECDKSLFKNLIFFLQETCEIIVNLSRLEVHQASNHRRIFYHSRTLLPILPNEMDEDSETESTRKNQWRLKQKRMMMQDFIDVNPGEKQMMAMWNEFMLQNRFRYYANVHIPYAVKEFIHLYTPEILRNNVFNNCILHLSLLHGLDLITFDDMHKAVQYIRKMRILKERLENILKRRSRSKLPPQTIELINYINGVTESSSSRSSTKSKPSSSSSFKNDRNNNADSDADKDELSSFKQKKQIAVKLTESALGLFSTESHLFNEDEINNINGIAVLALLSLYNTDDPKESKMYESRSQMNRNLYNLRKYFNKAEMLGQWLEENSDDILALKGTKFCGITRDNQQSSTASIDLPLDELSKLISQRQESRSKN